MIQKHRFPLDFDQDGFLDCQMGGKYRPLKIAVYTVCMKLSRAIPVLLAFLAISPAVATEVYHWVDENGVAHFSQSAPAGTVQGVEMMTLEDTTPPDYDPEEDIYGVAAQAERMAALRKEMDEKREAAQERRRNAPTPQPAVQYQEPYSYGTVPYWRQPVYPVHPIERPPVAVPYPIDTLRPPGRGLD